MPPIAGAGRWPRAATSTVGLASCAGIRTRPRTVRSVRTSPGKSMRRMASRCPAPRRLESSPLPRIGPAFAGRTPPAQASSPADRSGAGPSDEGSARRREEDNDDEAIQCAWRRSGATLPAGYGVYRRLAGMTRRVDAGEATQPWRCRGFRRPRRDRPAGSRRAGRNGRRSCAGRRPRMPAPGLHP